MKDPTRKIAVAFVLWALALGTVAATASAQAKPAPTPPPPAAAGHLPAVPRPAAAPQAPVRPPTPAPPWGGAKVTKEQGLQLENDSLKIELLYQQALEQFNQNSASFRTERQATAEAVMKANPGYVFDEQQVTFYKRPTEVPAPAAPAPAKPAPPAPLKP